MDEIEAFALELLQKHMEIAILPSHQLLADIGNPLQLLLRRHIRHVPALHAIFLLVLQACHADHEKFIQIGAGDGQKFQFFQQWIIRIHRFLQHPSVELQP